MIEEWRKVEGWPYEVSNSGRVRRSAWGSGTVIGKLLKPQIAGHGYLVVSLCAGGNPIKAYVHSLVLAAFVGVRPEGMQINHKDGNKRNNGLENLEYVTPIENMRHAISSGLFIPRAPVTRCGEESSGHKLTSDQVMLIREELSRGPVTQNIANRFGVSYACIWSIAKGRSWVTTK